MWWSAHSGMGWWMLLGSLWMLLFWGAIIWLIAWGVKKASGPEKDGREDPLEIAKRRYAKGEITKEEFEEIKSRLR